MSAAVTSPNEFEELLRGYHGPLSRLCRFYFDDPASQEDLYQEIALALWRSLPSYRGNASLRTWLYRVAHNVALTYRRRQRTRAAREITGIATVSQPVASDPQPDAAIEGERQWLALRAAIQELAPTDRQLILLHLEGLGLAEMEAISGLRAGAIATRLSRLRDKLAVQLGPKEARRP